jgi:P27 family predicted phage terminase small subunit
VSRSAPPDPGEPERPADLGEAALAVWDSLTVVLRRMGVLAQTDSRVLIRYCDAYARWRECVAMMAEHGQWMVMTKTEEDGSQITVHKARPQFKMARELATELTALEREMGLTPSSRTRINVTDSKKAGKAGTEESGKARFFTPAPLKLA